MREYNFESDGFCIVPDVLTVAECDSISRSLDQLQTSEHGYRNLLDQPWCKTLAQSIRRHPSIRSLLPIDALAVQCTLFEKPQGHNWLVPIHQDLSIPVREKLANAALVGWSEKQGVMFVQPPDLVLERLVAVRLHIDACGIDDGALRVVPGSHQFGRLANAQALAVRDKTGEVVCPVAIGGALLLKPLALHASSKATGSNRRRILHLVFGPAALPFELRWHQAV